ncbi:L-rhamnose mutarotase [Asticcacaulis machinosus]|uniref:L-rhamnose mutarotase n=1 Tax=Asticcacaulis machinosus TaxID=2984211 RepID=A0ABT5HJY6_9CAUL|nr:L-rhamnose mutarotase [Asticcacaulis machinosus]MDC7675924.1 L-rhamnose mutarotase [Asticcacaulis machinosus]
MTLTRHCFALDLNDDPALIERYKDWHRPGKVPSAVIASIRAADIRDMQIWQTGDRMFMIMETGPQFSPAAKAASDASSADVQAWEHLMWQFQKPLPFAKPGEKWVALQSVFDLSEQP